MREISHVLEIFTQFSIIMTFNRLLDMIKIADQNA